MPADESKDGGQTSGGAPGARASDASDRLFVAVSRYGAEAVAFQTLKPGFSIWTDAVSGTPVPYLDTGAAWVTAGLPLAPESQVAAIAERFARAGLEAGRRTSWFSAERRLVGFPALLIGEQPEWRPADWEATVSRARGLREQLRRARVAGVKVRAVGAGDISEGRPLRVAVDALAAEWLRRRHLEPMRFLVTIAPWERPECHRYLVAEQGERLVGFLSAVPIPARRGWFFEDLIRYDAAPNGTSELLIDAAMRWAAREDAQVATLGLVALGGPVAGWLRVARWIGRGLYNFGGLRSFRAHLRPGTWKPVWLLVPPGRQPVVGLFDVLRAFMGDRPGRFILRSLLRHPSATCVALALPLVPWTLLLALLVALGAHGPLGFSRGGLGGWVVFDAFLDVALWWTARRPRLVALMGLAALSSADAVISSLVVLQVGIGHDVLTRVGRIVAVSAPLLGAALLWWSAFFLSRPGDGGQKAPDSHQAL